MTKREFARLAEAVRFARVDDETRAQLALDIARALHSADKRFDFDGFQERCKPVAMKTVTSLMSGKRIQGDGSCILHSHHCMALAIESCIGFVQSQSQSPPTFCLK